jgi:ferredoxin-NADP reductase
MLKLSTLITAHIQLAPDIWLIQLKCPQPFVFSPGQYVLVHIDHLDPSTKAPYPRAYSIAGYVGTVAEDGKVQASEISLIYKRYAGGVATTCLEAKRVGDSLTIQGPAGHYTLARHLTNESKVLNFVVTGTGIAPAMCMLQSLSTFDLRPSTIRLYWGLPTRHDLYLQKELADFKREFARRSINFSIILGLSQEKEGALPDIDQCEVFGSRIQPIIDKKIEASRHSLSIPDDCHPGQTNPPAGGGIHAHSSPGSELVASESSDLFSLCGSGAFVQDMRKYLISHGIAPKQIIFERFS